MRCIKLTEKQKEILLEMCQTLFPEYETIRLDVPEELNNNHIFIIGFFQGNDYIPNCDLYVHWFEFCHTFLIARLSQINPKTDHDYEMLLSNCYINDRKHIIDYLYKEFKKIKTK